MTKQFKEDNPPSNQKSLTDLQKQFNELCAVGMRGAEAIANHRDNPKDNLKVVKNCTAEIRQGLSELKRELEAAKIPLINGEKIFVWEYEALKKITNNAGHKVEDIERKIKLQNGSVMELNLSGIKIENTTPFVAFRSLQVLNLSSTLVKDLTPIADLCSLQKLHLSETSVKDLAPLAGFSSLRLLDLFCTPVRDLTPLISLCSLQKLWVEGTPALTTSKDIIAALENRGVVVFKE